MTTEPQGSTEVQVGEDEQSPAAGGTSTRPRGAARWVTGLAALSLMVNLGAGVLFFVEQASAAERMNLRAETEELMDEARQRKDALLDEIAKLNKDVEQAEEERESARNKTRAVQSDLSVAQRELESARKDIAEAAAAQAAIDGLRTQRDTETQLLRDALAAKQKALADIDELNQRKTALGTQLVDLQAQQGRATSLEATITRLEADEKSLTDKIGRLESQRDSLDGTLKRLNDNVVKARTEAANIDAERNELRVVEATLLRKRSEVNELETKKALLDGQVTGLKDASAKWAKEIGLQTTQLQELKQRIAAKETELEAGQ